MSAYFTYNSVNPFTGIAPTPLLRESVEMVRFGERWGQKRVLTLEGQITGKCLTYAQIVARQQTLLSGFNKDFQSFVILEPTGTLAQYDFVKVVNISCDPSTYASPLLPFSVTLEAYPSGYFSGQYGVLDPREDFNFTEEEDGTVKLTHSTSAQGFVTSASTTNNALTNAQSWVAARTGWSSQVLPAFISGFSGAACLQTINENTDRLNARYEVVETYVGDIYGNASASGLLRYSTDFSSGIEDGICQMEVRGDLKGCRYQAISGLRARYAAFNAYSEAVSRFYRIAGRYDLHSDPLTKAVAEDVNARLINFSYVYNDDLRPRVNIIYEIGFDYDFERDTISASISATVSSRAPYTAAKWATVLQVANAVNLYSILVPAYNIYVAEIAPHLAAYPLNPVARSIGRTDNEFICSVVLSASYDNAALPPPGLQSYSPKVNITPSLHKYSPNPILDGAGEYYIFDLGFANRASVQIQVEGVGADNFTPSQTLDTLKSKAQQLRTEYFAGSKMFLDSQSYVTGSAAFNKTASVSVSYSAEQAEFSLS